MTASTTPDPSSTSTGTVRPTRARLVAAALAGAALFASAGCGAASSDAASSDKPVVGIIVKSADSGYFKALRAGAEQEGKALGVDVRSYAGKGETDTATQIDAIKKLIAADAKGILITPSGADVLPAIAEARKAGLLVVALDSPTDPADAVDTTFATDNFTAGRSIGQWAATKVDPATARIAMLDLTPAHVPVDVARDQGFLTGFGIDLADPKVIGDESDPRIVGHETTNGDKEGGQAAMEKLLAKDPAINLVYTINEGSALGAHTALVAAGRADKVVVVSIDGGCEGIKATADGAIGATAMQFPLRMARLGIDAVIDHALTGDVPQSSPGLAFFNTGSQLVTDKPADGLYSKGTDWASKQCWG
ncbi:mannose-binding protein /fructose-binding protein /ribose-binding protein [Quadrisphaera granulorum]|uniref:Mannose-binding protein /fructose-binding protein /ribose-binding protein n=1 Tax=Quadrisphaera granulorum TaxID=317664 RepID=A0A316ADV6_9ACTN|nr:substrate-binding domain-containing protein [Quadrisphaera granulorum]PWJ55792.1 mannose-binding protein /fructose-binding protein /ribose-binding protein [Quadrisphaera granulorum]SZE95289.1 mannose-binding protein /fructose-binding protein /ribose-binding protein [Quadrisphaera granulorum]